MKRSSDPVLEALQVSHCDGAGTRAGRLQRWLRTWGWAPAELDSAELVAECESRGDAHLFLCCDGEQVRLLGRVVAMTLFAAGSSCCSVTVDDGTGLVDIQFSDLRQPPPQAQLGAKLEVAGRLQIAGGRPVLVDPALSVLPG